MKVVNKNTRTKTKSNETYNAANDGSGSHQQRCKEDKDHRCWGHLAQIPEFKLHCNDGEPNSVQLNVTIDSHVLSSAVAPVSKLIREIVNVRRRGYQIYEMYLAKVLGCHLVFFFGHNPPSPTTS